MKQRPGTVVRLATPLKAWAQRFAVFLLIGATFSLMMLGKVDTVVVERARIAVLDAVAPILDVASRPVSSINHAFDEAQSLAAVREQNAALQEEVRRLAGWYQEAQRLSDENRSLRSLVNLAPDPQHRTIAARVVGDQGSAYVRSVLVTAGSQEGVRKNQAALTGSGLAGRVIEVGWRASRILLITDINSRIPVLVGQARDRAVLAGDNSEHPELLYLSPGTSISPGDRVVTSGHGGVFPAGLSVGIVAAVDEQGVRVRSFADWSHMEFLQLIDYELPDLLGPLTNGAAVVNP
ncbi:rod shape-determining protein MreC [Algihabitans albus]|uniref:rod shape-determining protein MreC n=1 Tax=Algihabitans albus TaxID=2164067 RepID=UPI000E5D57CF|nr:rod shape-determining protein MreC [Algihabitans albus]